MQYLALIDYLTNGGYMTKDTFSAICNEHGIDPRIALENDKVRQALRLDDVYWLIAILTNDF